jgi:hypothetical protein
MPQNLRTSRREVPLAIRVRSVHAIRTCGVVYRPHTLQLKLGHISADAGNAFRCSRRISGTSVKRLLSRIEVFGEKSKAASDIFR